MCRSFVGDKSTLLPTEGKSIEACTWLCSLSLNLWWPLPRGSNGSSGSPPTPQKGRFWGPPWSQRGPATDQLQFSLLWERTPLSPNCIVLWHECYWGAFAQERQASWEEEWSPKDRDTRAILQGSIIVVGSDRRFGRELDFPPKNIILSSLMFPFLSLSLFDGTLTLSWP